MTLSKLEMLKRKEIGNKCLVATLPRKDHEKVFGNIGSDFTTLLM